MPDEGFEVEDGGEMPAEIAEAINHMFEAHPERVVKVYEDEDLFPDYIREEDLDQLYVEEGTGRRYMLLIQFED